MRESDALKKLDELLINMKETEKMMKEHGYAKGVHAVAVKIRNRTLNGELRELTAAEFDEALMADIESLLDAGLNEEPEINKVINLNEERASLFRG